MVRALERRTAARAALRIRTGVKKTYLECQGDVGGAVREQEIHHRVRESAARRAPSQLTKPLPKSSTGMTAGSSQLPLQQADGLKVVSIAATFCVVARTA